MSTPQPTTDAVELRYTLSAEDLVDAFTAQYRVARRPWHQRRKVQRLIIFALPLVLAVLIGLYRGMPGPALAVFAVLVALVGGVWLVVSRSFDPARLARRLMVNRIMASNPAFAEPVVCTVSPAGLRLATVAAESTLSWARYPYHAETDTTFALFASDRLGAAVLALPRRGLDGTRVERLRELLDSHSRRLG